MKKLMVAAAVVAFAMCTEAAVFKWTTGAAVAGVTTSDVVGNGSYDASTSVFLGGNNSAFTYEVLMYTQGHLGEEDFLVGSKRGDVSLGTTGKAATNNINVDGTSSGVTYDFILKLSVVQTDLTEKDPKIVGDTKYIYDGAKLSYEGSGSVSAKSSAQNLAVVPGAWTVSGITTEAVPEPTSGLLLLIGVAGLALRRRRA